MGSKHARNKKRFDADGERFGKMRRKPAIMKADKDLRESFELPEDQWPPLLAQHATSKTPWFAARVVEVQKRYAFLAPEAELGEIDTRDVWIGTVAKRFLQARRAERNLVVVGDRVLCQPSDDQGSNLDLPQCLIRAMSPRRTRLSRPDPAIIEREHILAANMDQVVVCASYLQPNVSWGLINRYLAIAESEGLSSVIVLNKRDLLAQDQGSRHHERCLERSAELKRLGYEVISLEAQKSNTRDPAQQRLTELLQGRISLITGHSGVGKSSIVNLFEPEIVQLVEPNTKITYKGRHTTTFASFIKLGNTDGFLIDTPGIRTFEVLMRDPIQLTHSFVELRPFLGKCRYRECRHVSEPDCQVLQAKEQGKISDWRYRSYLSLLTGQSGREGHLEGEVQDDNFEE